MSRKKKSIFDELKEAQVAVVLADGKLKAIGKDADVKAKLSLIKENKGQLIAKLMQRATGYSCGKCGTNDYQRVMDGWRCTNCGMEFEIIGGSNGPQLIVDSNKRCAEDFCRYYKPKEFPGGTVPAGQCRHPVFGAPPTKKTTDEKYYPRVEEVPCPGVSPLKREQTP